MTRLRTIAAIFRKETIQVLRDRKMVIQIVFPPIMQMLVLAQAMTFEVKETNLALVDLDGSPTADRLVEEFVGSGRFDIALSTASGTEADRALLSRDAGAILRIPEDFGRNIDRGQPADLQLVLNAEDGAAAGVVAAYFGEIISRFSQDDAVGRVGAAAVSAPGSSPGVTVETRKLYNPRGEYLPYMAIGLLASLVTLVGVLLTSQNVAREREIGTLEQLNVTPITKAEFIIGKLAPFWVLGLIELSIGLSVIRFGFRIPFAGPVLVVYLAAAVYLFAALGLGLLISTSVATQQQAQFVTFFVLVTFLFFGGIFTPVASMPPWAQVVAKLNPIQHFADILRTVLIRGGGLEQAWLGMLAMAAFAAVVLPLAVVRYRKTEA